MKVRVVPSGAGIAVDSKDASAARGGEQKAWQAWPITGCTNALAPAERRCLRELERNRIAHGNGRTRWVDRARIHE